MPFMPLAILLALAVLGGCASKAQRLVAENAAIERQAAVEIDRICSLPPPERKADTLAEPTPFLANRFPGACQLLFEFS